MMKTYEEYMDGLRQEAVTQGHIVSDEAWATLLADPDSLLQYQDYLQKEETIESVWGPPEEVFIGYDPNPRTKKSSGRDMEKHAARHTYVPNKHIFDGRLKAGARLLLT